MHPACVLQVRDLLKVEWVQGDPARGMEYVYVSEEDYQKVRGSVKAALSVQPSGEALVTCSCGATRRLGIYHSLLATLLSPPASAMLHAMLVDRSTAALHLCSLF